MISGHVSALTIGTEEDTVSVFSGQAFWLQGEGQEEEETSAVSPRC